jgi:hypothetical protein
MDYQSQDGKESKDGKDSLPEREMSECAFLALINQIKVGMVYGDKEATLVLKFRPEGNIVEGLNALMVIDKAVMVAIVPMDKIKENHAVQKRQSRKPKGETPRGEV